MRIWNCLILFLILGNLNGFAQTAVSSTEIDLNEKPSVSPNTGSLSKYFDVPVNMSTGIPNIQIPLYTIQSGNIKIPIALSYHAGGIKLDEDASWVGMGWSLSTEASISKRVNGFDDLYTAEQSSNTGPKFNYTNPDYGNYFYLTGLNSITEIVDSAWTRGQDTINAFWGRLASGYVDGESDEYFFSTPTGGGSIYYNQKTQTYETSRIDGWQVLYDFSSNRWYLTDKNGLLYFFEAVEYILNPVWEYYGTYYPYHHYLPNTWRMNGLLDQVNGKFVGFSYEDHYQDRVVLGMSQYIEYNELYGQYNSGQAEYGTNLVREGDELSVTQIGFDEGRVDFIKESTRKDGVTPALKELRIYNKNDVLLKKFKFEYFYPQGVLTVDTCSRIFLGSIQEVNYSLSGDSLISPAYKFDYDTSIHLPYKHSKGQDYWGYYNGKNSNANLYPTIPSLTAFGVPTQSNRKVDTAYTRAGILRKITYPTGGSLTFDFENNTTVDDTTYVGGLRVKRITNYDSVAKKTLIKEYSYQNGSTFYDPTFHYFYIHQGTGYGSTTPRVRISGTPRYPLFPANGSPIVYGTVTEKLVGGGDELKTVHNFTDYTFHMGYYYDDGIGVPNPKIPIAGDFVGLENKTQVLKKNSDNSYSVIQTDSTEYSYIADTSKRIWNVQAAWVSAQGGSEWFVWPSNDPFNQGPHGIPIWGATSQHVYQTIPEIAIKTKSYSKYTDGQNTISQPVFYKYDSTNGSMKEIRSVTTLGDTTIKIIKYSKDFLNTGATSGINQQIDLLQYYNVVTAPIEILTLLKKKDSSNAFLEEATLYEYNNLKPYKIYKVYERMPFSSFNVAYNNSYGFYKDSHYTLFQEITSFDSNKNPQTVITKTNKQSYIWDTSYVIARTINAANDETAYTSFESSQKGNWNYSGSTTTDNTGITGKKVYLLTNDSITITNLTSTTYIVSYWGKNGNANVNGSGPSITGKSIGNWTYYEHQVTGSSFSVTGSIYIDELRLYPKGALMSTYFQEPLMGTVTECDQNNRLVYYEYSGPGQLKLIKDEDGKILKKVDYQYQKTFQD